MRCPNCGATYESGRFCQYCGSELPHDGTQNNLSDNARQTIINNYYYGGKSAESNSTTRSSDSQFSEDVKQVFDDVKQSFNSAADDARRSFNEATDSFNTKSNGGWSQKRLIAFLLCFFLGTFGVHYFYVGRWGMGLLYLFTMGLWGIGWLVDVIRIIAGTFPRVE